MIVLAVVTLIALLAGFMFVSVNAASDGDDAFVYRLSVETKVRKDGTQMITEGKRRIPTGEKRKLTPVEKRRAFMLMSWSLLPAIVFTVLYILGVR